MARISSILFDFGDTLFRRQGGYRLVHQAASELDLTGVTDAQAEKGWNGAQADSRLPEELAKGRDLSQEGHLACWTDLYRRHLDYLAPGMGAKLAAYEQDPDRWAPFDDTARVLTELSRAGVPVGVVSDTGWDIRPAFRRYGLQELIGVFVLSGEHGKVKPAPELFRAACAALGVREHDTLMVGDSFRTDGGAAESGIWSLVLPRPTPDEGERGLDVVLTLTGVLSAS